MRPATPFIPVCIAQRIKSNLSERIYLRSNGYTAVPDETSNALPNG